MRAIKIASLNSPREDIGIMRTGKGLFKFLQLVAGERGAVTPLLPLC